MATIGGLKKTQTKYCDCCGQKIQQSHKEFLNKHKLVMLQSAAKIVMETMKNDFSRDDLDKLTPEMSSHSNYANFQKLRYHGLVAKVTDKKGNRVRGRWLITKNGWAFLRGVLQVNKYVLVKNNHIYDRSKELVGVKDIWHGSDIVNTTFEYFDDDGTPVGVLPVYGVNEGPQINNNQQGLGLDVPVRRF